MDLNDIYHVLVSKNPAFYKLPFLILLYCHDKWQLQSEQVEEQKCAHILNVLNNKEDVIAKKVIFFYRLNTTCLIETFLSFSSFKSYLFFPSQLPFDYKIKLKLRRINCYSPTLFYYNVLYLYLLLVLRQLYTHIQFFCRKADCILASLFINKAQYR